MGAERRKKCIRCGGLKTRLEFSNDKRVSGRYPWCKQCSATYQRSRRSLVVVGANSSRECPVCRAPLGGTHKNRRYDTQKCKATAERWAAYGLSPAEARALIAARGDKCPICWRRTKKWNLDHSHVDGVVQGYVCSVCNVTLLAYSRHDIEIAKRLVAFLEAPPAVSLLGVRKYVGEPNVPQLHRRWLWTGERDVNVNVKG